MRRSKPYLQQEDRNILNSDPQNEQAEAYNKVDESLINKNLPIDPYERVQAEVLNGISHGGYINPQNRRGGYINPTSSHPTGGFLPFLAPIAAAFLPDVVKWLGSKFTGNGMTNITGGMISTTRPMSMINGHSFYKTLADDLSSQVPKQYIDKKFDKLFGSGWKKYYNRKVGGSQVDELKMGHIIMPPLFGHLTKALSGSGINPEVVMEALEKMPIMEKKVTHESLVHGGSIFGTIWNAIKGLFTSDNAKSVISAVAPKAIEVIGNYANSKMKQPEPEPRYSRPKRRQEGRYRPVEDTYEEEEEPSIARKTIGRVPGYMYEGYREKARDDVQRGKYEPHIKSAGLSSKKKTQPTKSGGSWSVKLVKE